MGVQLDAKCSFGGSRSGTNKQLEQFIVSFIIKFWQQFKFVLVFFLFIKFIRFEQRIGFVEQFIERATELRARHGFRTPDAIHLATAIEERADLVLTGDVALRRCSEVAVEVVEP